MLRNSEYVRDLIAEAVRSTVDRTVRKHHGTLTQEPQLTSRIAEALEARLDGMVVLDHTVRVIAQEMPDRGSASLERPTGIDLYIGLEVLSDGPDVSKGIIIQAKWEKHLAPKQREELVGQCEKMLARSDKGSFVWLYGPAGASVIPASEVVAYGNTSADQITSENVGQLFGHMLDCVSGDRNLVIPGIFDDRQALSEMLEELRIRNAVAISIMTPEH
jgi:hypothetical protein